MMLRSLSVLVVVLISGASVVSAADSLSADERWRWLQGESADRYVRFLLDHPDSVHVPQARAYLEARDDEPLGRLVEPDQACRKLVQERAQQLLKRAPSPEMDGRYSLSLPQDHFITASTYIEVPRGQTSAQTPIEHRLTINLVAERDGGCVVYERWSSGSGLGQACRCEPVDSHYRFRSRLADGVLKDVARMRAGDSVCNGGHADSINAFLREVIAAKQQRAERLRAHKARGKTLYPTEQQELEDIEYAMPVLQAGVVPVLVEEEERARLQALPTEVQGAFCQRGLAGGIERARERIVEMAPLLP
jgi:hypothetical protein